MNTIVWNPTGFYVLGSALCILAQFIIIFVLLARRHREKLEIQVLRSSERMYRSLAENAEDVITRLAPDGRILYVSPACQGVFGYAPEEVLGQGAGLLIHPEDSEHTWDIIYKAEAAGNEHYCVPNRIRHKQGHWVWTEIRGRLLYNRRGERAEIHCLIRDMTDRKQAEDILRANEEKFRALFSLVPIGISVSTFQEGRFLEVNEGFLRALGYQRDEVIGKTSLELGLPTSPAGREQFLAPIRQHGSVRDMELDMRTKSGVVLNTLFSCEAVDIGGQQCLITAFMDITRRKRNEEALRESEAKFRTIFENAPLSMSINRISDRVYLDVNRKFVESAGASQSEILGKKPFDGLMHILEESGSVPLTQEDLFQGTGREKDLVYQADIAKIGQEFQARGKVENFYFRSHIGNGSAIHNLISVYPIILQGEACTLSITTDITGLKKTEEELREREEKYHVLFDNMAQGAMYCMADGRIDEVNDAALKIFNVSYDEFVHSASLSAPTWNVVHEDGSKLSPDEWPAAKALKTGQPVGNVTVGVSVPHKQTPVWVTITAIPQFKPGDTRPYRVFTTFHDVTALKQIEQDLRTSQEHLEELVEERTNELRHEIESRKQVEQSLRESEALYRLIAENATDVIETLNSARQFTYLSPSVQQLLGYTPEELNQEMFWPLLTPESKEIAAHIIARKRADDPEPTRLEVELIRKDGSTVWVETIVKRLYDTMGQHSGFLGITRDISERKQVEAALQQAKDVAEAANQAKSMFLSNMSHELRTPLNAILGFAQILARESTLSPEQRNCLETINRSGEHLLKLINDVLNLSKIEAGRISVNRQAFDFWHMLASIEEMIRVRADAKGLEFSIDRATDVPHYIITDEGKLRQVLINLLGNAVKFTEQGEVTLRVNVRSTGEPESRSKGKELPASVRPTPQYSETSRLQFEISDSGPGIPPEELPTIFEAFRQTSSVQSREGAGLGLGISRKFVQMLGGDIQVYSTVGQGSQFTCTIQVEPAEHGNIATLSPARVVRSLAPNHPSITILVVDDHVESRQFLTLLLSNVGFTVKTAGNGREALTQTQEWPPDLILMDMRMPVMDGYEATREIRKLEEHRDAQSLIQKVPIIALTANVFEEEEPRILDAGCDAVLHKPISTDELFETIRTYLNLEYLYAEDTFLPENGHSAGKHVILTQDALAALPGMLVEKLEQTIRKGNRKTIVPVVEEIRQRDPDLADTLAYLAYNFKYQTIWDMIQQMRATGGHTP